MIPHSRQEASQKRELDRLDAALGELKVEFDKFFNGAVRVPPETLRSSIELRLRKLRNRRMRLFADQFRLNNLETRFNVLNELFNRRLREMEKASRKRETPAREGSRAIDPFAGVALENGADHEAAEALYQELYRSSGRSRKVDFNTFQTFLGRQIERVQKKTGCTRVLLRVAGEGDELKLKAKPERGGKALR